MSLTLHNLRLYSISQRVSQYRCFFDEVHAVIREDEVVMEGIVNARNFKESSITKLGLFET